MKNHSIYLYLIGKLPSYPVFIVWNASFVLCGQSSNLKFIATRLHFLFRSYQQRTLQRSQFIVHFKGQSLFNKSHGQNCFDLGNEIRTCMHRPFSPNAAVQKNAWFRILEFGNTYSFRCSKYCKSRLLHIYIFRNHF